LGWIYLFPGVLSSAFREVLTVHAFNAFAQGKRSLCFFDRVRTIGNCGRSLDAFIVDVGVDAVDAGVRLAGLVAGTLRDGTLFRTFGFNLCFRNDFNSNTLLTKFINLGVRKAT
jgi:hypothetical protein